MAERPDHKTVGMIPARYGSRRLPGKPLMQISGKSLIQRTYENAQRSPLLNRLYVVTDDERIFEHVLGFGGEVIMTPPECPTGTERLAKAVKNNGKFDDVEIIVNIQGDEPFLEQEVIESVVRILQEDSEAVMSTAVVPIHDREEAVDYSVNKCVMDTHGNALYFSRTLIPSSHTGEWRPDANYYKHLGIYGYRRQFLMHYADLEPTPLQIAEDLEQLKVLEHGYRMKVAIVESQAIGVDTPEDIKKVEEIL
ncbi:MAG: 3-deoxy-manno-octulosonate cytidylyltransferase [Waddliaceae bacterium]